MNFNMNFKFLVTKTKNLNSGYIVAAPKSKLWFSTPAMCNESDQVGLCAMTHVLLDHWSGYEMPPNDYVAHRI